MHHLSFAFFFSIMSSVFFFHKNFIHFEAHFLRVKIMRSLNTITISNSGGFYKKY